MGTAEDTDPLNDCLPVICKDISMASLANSFPFLLHTGSHQLDHQELELIHIPTSVSSSSSLPASFEHPRDDLLICTLFYCALYQCLQGHFLQKWKLRRRLCRDVGWRRGSGMQTRIRVSRMSNKADAYRCSRILTIRRGIAEGAVVQSTGSVDDDTTVQFYSSCNCQAGTETARANGGCLDVDNEVVPSYQSFKVVSSPPVKSRSVERRLLRERRRYDNHTSSGVPKHNPHEPIIFHGKNASFDGIQYRWHQVHATGFMGIPPHEWDDNVHVKNDTVLFIDWSKATTDLTQSRDLDERDLLGLCQTFMTCFSGARDLGVTVGDTVGGWAVNLGTSIRNGAVKANDFFNGNPFITQVVAGTIAGVASNKISAWIGGKAGGDGQNIAACSSLGDQIDALKSIVLAQESKYSASSMSISTQQSDAGDEVSTLTLTTVTCGDALTTSCGVPAGFCT